MMGNKDHRVAAVETRTFRGEKEEGSWCRRFPGSWKSVKQTLFSHPLSFTTTGPVQQGNAGSELFSAIG